MTTARVKIMFPIRLKRSFNLKKNDVAVQIVFFHCFVKYAILFLVKMR